MKLFRCSALKNIMTAPKSKNAVLSETAKSEIKKLAKEDVFGYQAFTGNKYTKKGIELESEAIRLSGLLRFREFNKNTQRLSNDYITGECDILTDDLIIDIKCSWDIGTHPFFDDDATAKVKEAGYDWQMQGYMWLYERELAEIDFWLLPTPSHLIAGYEDGNQLIDLVNSIDVNKRLKTVKIERDEAMITKMQEVIPHAQAYYADKLQELGV